MPTLPVLVPSGYRVLVKDGQKINPGQIIASYGLNGKIEINIAMELGVDTKDAGRLLLVNPGDRILRGDKIAARKRTFRRKELNIVSKIAGRVESYKRREGILVIDSNTGEKSGKDILAPIDGYITLCNNGQVAIDTQKDCANGNKGYGGSANGVFAYIPDIGSGEVATYQLVSDLIGKIAGGKYFNREMLMKAASMDIKGIIAQRVEDEDIEYLNRKKIDLPIVELRDQFSEVSSWDGKDIYLDGKTRDVILIKN